MPGLDLGTCQPSPAQLVRDSLTAFPFLLCTV